MIVLSCDNNATIANQGAHSHELYYLSNCTDMLAISMGKINCKCNWSKIQKSL